MRWEIIKGSKKRESKEPKITGNTKEKAHKKTEKKTSIFNKSYFPSSCLLIIWSPLVSNVCLLSFHLCLYYITFKPRLI